MSKLFYSMLLLAPLFLFSCSDSENEDSDNENKTYKVRYEGTSKTPNTKIRVLYTIRNARLEHVDEDVIEEFLVAPFSKELTMQKGDYCYLSVSNDYRDENEFNDQIEFTSSIYVDDIKKAETNNKVIAISNFLLFDLE